MKIGKKIFVGIYVCLFALTITLSGVIVGFSALNSDFSSPFEVNYYTTPEILSDSYGYYVEMGEYPQTFGGYVDTDGNATYTDSSGDTITITMTATSEIFTYVAKGGSTATADVYVDSEGNRYIQYTAAAYSTSYYYSDYINTTSSEATWFKIEPIKWRILGYYEDSTYTNALVDDTAVFVQITSVSDENYSNMVAHSDAIIVQSELGLEGVLWNISQSDVDYTDSTIYRWLENFYTAILSDYDSYISYRTIDYNDTSETSSSEHDTAVMTTSEKIWLISYTEAGGVFYSGSTARLCSPSDFGLATHCWINTNYISNYRTGTGEYWMRSSFFKSSDYYARRINTGGNVDTNYVSASDYAVRPAMLLNLSSTDTNTTAISVSGTAGLGSVNETLLTSTASTKTAILTITASTDIVILTTASASEKRRLVLLVEN